MKKRKELVQKMNNNSLIMALDNAIMSAGSNCEQVAILLNMRTREKEKILLEQQDWNAEKRIYTTSTGYFKTKRPIQVCRAKREDIINKIYEYYYGNDTYTLDECFKLSMVDMANDVKWEQRKSTSKMLYESNWKRFFENYPIAKRSISSIKAHEILNHLKQITFELKLSRRGLNDAKTILNRAFDYAVNNDIISVNIARNVSTSSIVCKHRDRSTLVYTDDEREALLREMERDEHIASRALSLMFCLCIRSGEVRALKWSDVDWDNETIYIHSQISRRHDENGHNIYVDEGQTKNHDEAGNRHQKLSSRALRILKEQRRLSPFSTYIFEYNGHVLEPNMLNRRLKKICELAGISYLSTHKIRFWSVTKMASTGVSATEMQAQAGHKSRQTTDYYIRIGRQNVLEGSVVEAMFS